jgi:hypothetical protein
MPFMTQQALFVDIDIACIGRISTANENLRAASERHQVYPLQGLERTLPGYTYSDQTNF